MGHNSAHEILERSAVGMAVLGGDDRLAYVNAQFAAMLGYTPADLTGKAHADIISDEGLAAEIGDLNRVRRGDLDSVRLETRYLTRDKIVKRLEVTAVGLAGRDRERGGVLLIVGELTSRRDSERGLAIQYLVSRILASANSFDEAIVAILAEMGSSLSWEVGAYWEVDETGQTLAATRTWRSTAHHAVAFEESTRALKLSLGVGIPGTVWAVGAPIWESDAAQIGQFPRLRAARDEGLHAVFAFPVHSVSQFYGVIEFFSRDVQPPDSTLINAAEGIGYQIGQFLERQRAQLSTQISEARKASILETALDCVVTIDEAGHIVEFNPAAEATFGYKKHEVIGKEMSEMIVPPSLRSAHRAGLSRYLATGEAHVLGRRIEITGMKSGGAEFPVELAIVRVPMPGPPFFTAYLRDLTERKRLEANQQFLLIASEQLSTSLDYETTVRMVAQLAVPGVADWCAVDIVTSEGTVKRVAVAHADPAKVAAVEDLERRFPTDPSSAVGAHEVIRRGESIWAAEIADEILRTSAQSPEHLVALRELGLTGYIIVPLKARERVLGALTLVSAESGRRFDDADVSFAEDLARRMAVAIDNALLLAETEHSRVRLTEQAEQLERTAEEMAAAHEELEVTNEELAATNEQLQRKTDEVSGALAQAEEANRAKSDFLATMSHELRTPLNAIGGYAELITLGIRGPVTEQQKADLARIQRSQSQLLTLINDILKFAKLQSGTVQFEINEFSLDEALCHSDDLIRPQIDEKNLAYRYESGAADITVCADPDRFQQVVLNLLSNAVKFTPPGGAITVTWKANEKNVAVSVADTGVGIPADKLVRVFDPFIQVNARAAKTTEGVGLGLAISRDIASRMNGTLTVESQPGEGSVFTLTLPRGKDCVA